MKAKGRVIKKYISGVIVAVILCTGCGATKQEAVLPEEGYIIAEDCFGDAVKIKEDSEYVASIFAATTHYIAMLGEVERVVAISEGNTRDYLFCEMFPSVLDARIAKGNSSISIEETMKDPKPEFIVVNPDVALDDTTKTRFQSMGVPVLTVAHETIQDQLDLMTLLGDVFNQEEAAAEYIEYYNWIVDLVDERIGHLEEGEKRPVYHAINELLRTDKPHSLSAEWTEAAGIHNIAFDILGTEEMPLTSKNYIGLEDLMQADPEYIIINGADVYDYIMANERFYNMHAYKNDQIYIMPLGVSRWGHPNSVETCMAILWTATTIYPEYFEDISMEEETKRFYSEIWNYELSDEQVFNILEGRSYKNIKGDGQSGL